MITRQRLLNFLSYGAHVLFFAVTSALMLICTTFMLHSAWTYDKLYVYDTCRLVDVNDNIKCLVVKKKKKKKIGKKNFNFNFLKNLLAVHIMHIYTCISI